MASRSSSLSGQKRLPSGICGLDVLDALLGEMLPATPQGAFQHADHGLGRGNPFLVLGRPSAFS